MKNLNLDKKKLASLVAIGYEINDGTKRWEDAETFCRANQITLNDGRPITAAYLSHIWPGIQAAVEVGSANLNTEEAPEAIAAKAAVNVENREDGSKSMDRLVVLYEGTESLTPDRMLSFFKLSPSDWVVKSSRCNAWNGPTTDGKQLLYQLRINVAPKTTKDFSEADIDAYIKAKADKLARPTVKPFAAKAPKKNGKVYKLIDLADLHMGLFAWGKETGSKNYDLQIAHDNVMKVISEFVNDPSNENTDEIVLATMGDILHVDTAQNTTTKGTRQDVEGRVPKMFDAAIRTMTEIIDKLLEMQVPIKYMYLPGNHDELMGYGLVKVIEATYAKNPNITFVADPCIFKVCDFGKTVVGLTHGEANNKRIGFPMLTQFREQYGKALVAEVHGAHLHSELLDTSSPVIVRRVNALCEPSYWEANQSFAYHPRGINVFTYARNIGGCISQQNYYSD